jgi:hypothetical protein
MRRFAFVLASILLFTSPTLRAQDAIPTEMLKQTYLIKVGDVIGTAFSVDYSGERYLVTARHILDGLPVQRAMILLWQQGGWKEIPTKRTLLVSPLNVDIAVLETYVHVHDSSALRATDDSKPSIGQKVWYLGYPSQSDTHSTSTQSDAPYTSTWTVPAIKRGTISAIDVSTPDTLILHIDGSDGPGFVGGPILCWDPTNHAFRILGVIQGHENDSAPPLIKSGQADTNASIGEGILIGYSVDYAMKAIKRPRE